MKKLECLKCLYSIYFVQTSFYIAMKLTLILEAAWQPDRSDFQP